MKDTTKLTVKTTAKLLAAFFVAPVSAALIVAGTIVVGDRIYSRKEKQKN